ncbi:MAG TPA: hypothetical protein VJT16_10200 [Streptosporangiaceae bacterium]|nr:hypothetical protein [Streptosporangiaceae bacterium]
MTGESEDPECVAGRDDEPHVDVPRTGTLMREVELVHPCRAARRRTGQIGDHDRGARIKGRL